MSEGAALPLRTLIAYALPALPLALLTLPFYVLVPPYYASNLGLGLASVGTALLAVRIVDALSDPLIGTVADRWRPRFGRRRLWFALASIPTAVAAALVLMPPEHAGLGWLLAFGTLLSIASTAAIIPYYAWGAELSTDYAMRSKITGWRESFAVVGTLIALSAQAIVPAMGFAGEGNVLAALALFTLLFLPATAACTIICVPEPVDATRSRIDFRTGLSAMRRNGPFLRLLAAFFLNGCANGLPATLFLFYVQNRLGSAGAVGPLLILYFLCGIAGVPIWLRLAARWGKHRTWSVAMIGACVFFSAAVFLGAGDVPAFAVVCVGTGLALGADLMLPPAIQADVIDVDTAETGEQRAGFYFAVWGFATKLALAAAVGVAFPLLAAAGFSPGAGAASKSGLPTLAFLYAGLPVILKLCAIALMWSFPLDRAAHAEVRARIDTAARG